MVSIYWAWFTVSFDLKLEGFELTSKLDLNLSDIVLYSPGLAYFDRPDELVAQCQSENVCRLAETGAQFLVVARDTRGLALWRLMLQVFLVLASDLPVQDLCVLLGQQNVRGVDETIVRRLLVILKQMVRINLVS